MFFFGRDGGHLGTGCPERRIPVGSPGGSGLRAGWMRGGRKCSCLQMVQCSASRRDDTLERTQELLHKLTQKRRPPPHHYHYHHHHHHFYFVRYDLDCVPVLSKQFGKLYQEKYQIATLVELKCEWRINPPACIY